MCTGFEAAIIASAVSAAGAGITANENALNASRQSQANNRVLQNTLLKNRELAEEAQGAFDNRLEQLDETPTTPQPTRQPALQASVTSPDDAAQSAALSISGDAPTIVDRTLQTELDRARSESADDAARRARLSSFGDMWFNQGLQTTRASRNVAHPASLAAANLGLLPVQQQLAVTQATRPNSGKGQILSSLGQVYGAYAGSQGAN